jgi:MOSC domain-containing protein YiiM
MQSSPKVIALFIGPTENGPVTQVDSVEAVAGSGLVGDRYFRGTYPEDRWEPKVEVTIFSSEKLAAAAKEAGIEVTPQDMRRNVYTEGVDVDALIGKRFNIGEVELEGIKANPPCRHLQELAGKKLLVKPLMEGGGIRARITVSGTIKIGDQIQV